MGILSDIFGFAASKGNRADDNSRRAIIGQAEGARLASAQQGFNPLTLLGVSSAVGPSGSNFFGTTTTEDALALANLALGRDPNAGTADKLQAQNQALQEQVRELALRAPVPGVYGQSQATTPQTTTQPEQSPYSADLPTVRLFNPAIDGWVNVHGGVAGRLGLRDGDTIIASDYEDILGDLASEAINTPNAANLALGRGNMFDPDPRFQRPRPRPLYIGPTARFGDRRGGFNFRFGFGQ